MSLSFESANYRWACSCGKKGRFLKFHKSVKASNRHQQEHERKLQWGQENQLEKENA
jgi:hypothetical protein